VGAVAIAERLFTTTAAGPRLIGSHCRACEAWAFPAQDSCPTCTGTDVSDDLLEPRGTLWTWTTQGFPPVSPPFVGPGSKESFVPFGIGWVALPGQLMIEARLTESDPANLAIGMPVELVLEPITTDDAGQDVLTFAFQPTVHEGPEAVDA